MSRAKWGAWLRRTALVAVAGMAVTAGAMWGPQIARRMDTFRVRQVEVSGTRFLDPYVVVRAAGLDRNASILDDADAWRAGVMTLPLVESVRTRRTFPGTVSLDVVEVDARALVSGSTLRPVDAEGRLIPLEPAGRVLDLPVLSGAEVDGGRVRGEAARAALALIGRLESGAPELHERLSEIEVSPTSLRALFRDGGPDALLPIRPTTDQLSQLRLALADLTARGELGRVRRIDVRFRDQVVVSFL